MNSTPSSSSVATETYLEGRANIGRRKKAFFCDMLWAQAKKAGLIYSCSSIEFWLIVLMFTQSWSFPFFVRINASFCWFLFTFHMCFLSINGGVMRTEQPCMSCHVHTFPNRSELCRNPCSICIHLFHLEMFSVLLIPPHTLQIHIFRNSL